MTNPRWEELSLLHKTDEGDVNCVVFFKPGGAQQKPLRD